MVSCAIEGCSNPDCPVCSVPRRFPNSYQGAQQGETMKPNAPALNGQKSRPSRDPSKIKRNRKALTP